MNKVIILLLCCSGAQCVAFWGDSSLDKPAEDTTIVTVVPAVSNTSPTQEPIDLYELPLPPIEADSKFITERCGSCQCFYKPENIRAICSGNITDVPTDLPRNITHL
jgi:hypothetical protein